MPPGGFILTNGGSTGCSLGNQGWTDWDNTTSIGFTSYASNTQVFSNTDSTGWMNAHSDWDGKPKVGSSFPDGTSQTIMIAEKYARCGTINSDFSANITANPNGDISANMWSWWQIQQASQPIFAATMPHVDNPGGNPMQPVGAASIFTNPSQWQVTSSQGFAGAAAAKLGIVTSPTGCDFYRPSSAHTGVMNAGFADGSVHSLSAGMSPNVWWALCTKNGGEVIDGSQY